MSTFLSLTGFTGNLGFTTPIDIGAEGTLDWFWCGNQQATQIPWLLTPTTINRKRGGPGWLYRGFRWRYSGADQGPISQNVGRSLSAAASVSNTGLAINNPNFTGFFQLSGTSVIGTGLQFVVPASRTKTRRLVVYSEDYRANVEATAKVVNGATVEASQSVSQNGINGRQHHTWTVDFQGGTDDSFVVLDVIIVSFFTGTDQSIGPQGATLAEAP